MAQSIAPHNLSYFHLVSDNSVDRSDFRFPSTRCFSAELALAHERYTTFASVKRRGKSFSAQNKTSFTPENVPQSELKSSVTHSFVFTVGASSDSVASSNVQNDASQSLSPASNSIPTSGNDAVQVWGSTSFDITPYGAKEPVYQVIEVTANGEVHKREVSRRQLLKSSGLRQRDVRRVDPSLWVTNSMPALLVRDHAILVNLGSLRAITTHDSVLIFDYASVGGQAFLENLLERLKLDADASSCGAATMPFELEVLESALISRTQRLENALMAIEPKVGALLEELPTHLNANALEELRMSKQALVELGSKAGALRQMLIELLDHPSDLKRVTAMGLNCRLVRKDGEIACDTAGDKILAEEEEQEVEMLLEYYLQRCDFVHGQAEKLLDSAKEMEDSISVNLSSRRLEVSRLELLLQVGAFAAALGALVAGIFGMNLRSKLEESSAAFWYTTWGIVCGFVLLFLSMFIYLKKRRIL